MNRPLVLTIAGSDPSGGAGIQSDLRTFDRLGAVGLSAVTALTIQNSQGVQSVFPVEGAVVGRQLRALLDDARPDAVKIGMLGSADQVRAVAAVLRDYGLRNVVLDPVLASTGGVPLLDAAGIDALLHDLLPLCAVITPNVGETERLTGHAVQSIDDLEAAANRLLTFGIDAVIAKGGHLAGEPTDILVMRSGIAEHHGLPRIDTPHTHGTGCLYSSALAVFLAQGLSLTDAFRKAKDLMQAALQNPVAVGKGRGYPGVAGSPPQPSPKGRELRDEAPPAFPDPKAHPFGQSGRRHPSRGDWRGGEERARVGACDTGRVSIIRQPSRGGSLRLPSSLPIHGLYIVTDPDLRPDRSHADVTRAALEGGARIVQLRDKRASARGLVAAGREMAALCRRYGALFIVNDRVDIALATDADGIHLGPDDMHPAQAREILGPDRIVGVSISSVEEAEPLIPYASYLGVGAVYGSTTKTDAGDPIGVGRIREIKSAFPHMPLVAIGGINARNIAPVFAAGADSAAVVSAVICAPDMTQATRELVAMAKNMSTSA